MRMSFGDTPTNKQEMITFLHAAVDRGITFFDKAEGYGPFPKVGGVPMTAWTSSELDRIGAADELVNM